MKPLHTPASLLLLALLCPLCAPAQGSAAAITPTATAGTPTGNSATPTAPDITLSPLAEQLAQYGEDAAGLRARLRLILAHITAEPELYKINTLPAPNPELIPIQVSAGSGRHLGGVQWAASNSIVRLRMSFFTAPLPPATDAATRLQREMVLTDTLVHELVHCFFYFRYPKLAKITQGEPLCICEGHAISAAHEFMSRHYYGGTGKLPHSSYESIFLSPRYARLYRQFRTRYLDSSGHILWHKVDAAELRHAPTGYTLRNRVQE